MRIPSLRTESKQALIAQHAGLDLLLGALQTIQPAEGLEARVLVKLQAQAARDSAANYRRLFYRDAIRIAWPHAYALSAAVALVCVFAGGWLAAHETSVAVNGHQARMQAAGPMTRQTAGPITREAFGAMRLSKENALGTRLATASAQTRPVRQVPVGRHRSRAAHGAGSTESLAPHSP